jgi:hypothetical protein
VTAPAQVRTGVVHRAAMAREWVSSNEASSREAAARVVGHSGVVLPTGWLTTSEAVSSSNVGSTAACQRDLALAIRVRCGDAATVAGRSLWALPLMNRQAPCVINHNPGGFATNVLAVDRKPMEELWPCSATFGWTVSPLPQALVHWHPHAGNLVLHVWRSWSLMEELWPCSATFGWTVSPLPQALVHWHPHAGNLVLHVWRGWSLLAAAMPPLASWRFAYTCRLRRPGSRIECLCYALGTHHDGGGREGPPSSRQVHC